MRLCVIVSHESGSEGSSVAREACGLLGYRYVVNQTIGKAARTHEIQGAEWRWLEQSWHRLFAGPDERPEVRLSVVRPILLKICADPRGALFFGRGIRELLQGYISLFSAHIVASFDTRVERIMRQVNLPRFGAQDRVHRSDKENAWFYHYFFHVDWSDRSRHDLVLDTSTVSPQEAARRLVAAIRHRPAADPASSATPVGHMIPQEG